MAPKTPATPRKTASSRKGPAKQSQVTPIRESNGAAPENGAAPLQAGLEEEIRMRAYQIYVERGGQHGFDQDDWARAEKEILSKYQREKSA
jgi:hypothetical protein